MLGQLLTNYNDKLNGGRKTECLTVGYLKQMGKYCPTSIYLLNFYSHAKFSILISCDILISLLKSLQ